MPKNNHDILNNQLPKSLFDLYQQFEPVPTLAYRGDTREPLTEIFPYGFSRRGASWDRYEKSKKVEELNIREEGNYDVTPSSAVCLTTVFDLAPLFPVMSKNEGEEPPTYTWIYVVVPQNAYPTYKMQLEKKSFLAFAKEIATRDVPSGDVLCAIKCERFINVSPDGMRVFTEGMHYRLVGDIIWNPKLANEPQTPLKIKRKQQIENLFKNKRHNYIQCPIPMYDEDHRAVEKGIFLTVGKKITEMQHQLINFVNCTKLIHARKLEMKEAMDSLKYLLKQSDFNVNIHIPGMNMTLPDYIFSSGLDELGEYLLYLNVRPTEHLRSCTFAMHYFLNLPQEIFAEIYNFKQELIDALADNTDDNYRAQVYPILTAIENIHRVPYSDLDRFMQNNCDLFDSIDKNQNNNSHQMNNG